MSLHGDASAQDLILARDGAQLFPGLALELLPELEALSASLPDDRAGLRLCGHPVVAALTRPDRAISATARSFCGTECRAVRSIFFDKSEQNNWALGWHQDRTVCVKQRIEQDGFGPWTIKQGMVHGAPPMSLLERMVTLRVHLDNVPSTNSPLLIAPGSHLLGFVAEADTEPTVARLGQVACLARAGDVWAYATPILHASQASQNTGRRRVLQIDFCAEELPGGLEWLGV